MAVESPLLETTISGATHVIVNVSGDITLADASDAASYVQELAGDEVNIIFGAMYDASKSDTCMITVIATGLEDIGTAATQSRMAQSSMPQYRARTNTLQGMNQPRQTAQPIYMQGGYSQPNYAQNPYQGNYAQNNYAQNNYTQSYNSGSYVQQDYSQDEVTQPAYTQSAQKTVTPTRPLPGINRPTDIRSSVEEKSLKIPDFLQRK